VRAKGLVDNALPFQVHGVPNVGNDAQLRAGDETRELLARGERRELVEGAVHDERGKKAEGAKPLARVVRERRVYLTEESIDGQI
jgi:hypothetical protein